TTEPSTTESESPTTTFPPTSTSELFTSTSAQNTSPVLPHKSATSQLTSSSESFGRSPTSSRTSTSNESSTIPVPSPTSETTLTSVTSELSTSTPVSTTVTESSTDGAITSPSQSQSPTPNAHHTPIGPIIGGILGGLVVVVVLLLLLYGRRLRQRYHLLPRASGDSSQPVQADLLVEGGPSAAQNPRGDSEISAPSSTQRPPQIPHVVRNDHIPGIDIIPFPFSESPLNDAKSGVSRSDPTIASTTPRIEEPANPVLLPQTVNRLEREMASTTGIEESVNPVLLQQTVNRLEREIADMQALLHSRNTDDEDQASESTLPPPYLS
ncbi:hypothetical protein H0H93_008268, partial [Arthromyces matolae]